MEVFLLFMLYSFFGCVLEEGYHFLLNGRYMSKRMLLNFLFIYFIIGFFYCICGKIKISLFLTSFIIFFVGIVNHFITTFRGTPLVPWDIFSLNVALTVLPTFKFTVTPKLIIGIILFILTFIILKKSQFDSFKNGKFKISYRIFVFVGTVTFTICFYLTNIISVFELDENWDPKEEYHNNGLVASLFKQSRNLIISKPEGYDINSITELANSIKVPLVNHENDESYEQPNIIVIMNESFADLSIIGNFTTNSEYDDIDLVHF